MDIMNPIRCKVCNRTPEEIPEYIQSARVERLTPTLYVMKNEGTYNRNTGRFYCSECYIEAGMPKGKADAEQTPFPHEQKPEIMRTVLDKIRKAYEEGKKSPPKEE